MGKAPETTCLPREGIGFLPVQSAASIGEDDGQTMDGSMVVTSAGDCEVVSVVCREWRSRFRGFGPPFYNIGLGATRDGDLAYKIGVATALEVRASGYWVAVVGLRSMTIGLGQPK
ncbi:beta-glucosidase [Sarracenia purpurea var. burkii]